MKKEHLLSFVIIFLGQITTVRAQLYRAYARHFGIEEGLPHRQINDVIEDRRGLIWTATDAGVARFDGFRFNTFNKAEQGLTNMVINRLMEDGAGNIWAIAHNSSQNITSIDVLDPFCGKAIPPAIYFKNHPIPVAIERLHRSGFRHKDGTLYFGVCYPAGYASYHPDRGWNLVLFQSAAVEFRVIKVTESKHVWGLLKANAERSSILVEADETGNILRQYDPQPGNRFDYYEGETGESDGFFIVENAPDWHHRLFWEIKPGGERTLISPPVDPAGIPTGILARLEEGKLVFNEMRLFDQQNKVILDLKKLYPGFGTPLEVAWLRDKRGGIWLGTAYGLILVDIRKDLFRRFLYDESGTTGAGISCRSMLEYNGKLFVNSERQGQGRYVVNIQNGTASPLQGGGLIYGIAADQSGRIWTDRGSTPADDVEGIVQISPANGQPLTTIYAPSKIWCIFPVNEQQFLLGCIKGIYTVNVATGALKPLKVDKFPEIANAGVVHIGRDRSGNIWACAETGLYQIDGNNELIARYWPGGKGTYFLPFDNVLHFYEDKDGIFWIGTRGDGLIRWDKKSDQKQMLFRNNGILNGYIYAIYEDDFGHLWMPTDYGIVQFDKRNLQVRHTWLTTDGLAQNEFNRTSHFRGRDGTLYFGGMNGVTAFHPGDFYDNHKNVQERYRLVISNFFQLPQDGQLRNETANVIKSNKLQMQPGDRYVQIEFAVLDFSNASAVSYFWKTEGVDADWNFLSKPELRLSNLSPGMHHLRIRAQASDGQWAENEIDVYIDVLPPFYLRTWFLLLVLTTMSLGIWYWQRRNIWEREKLQQRVEAATAKIQEDKKTIEQQAVELRQLDEAKSRFFVNISHELRTPLTLMLGPLSSALESKKLNTENQYLIQLANTHGKNLLGMVNQILDLSKLEAGRLDLQEKPVLLQRELERMTFVFKEYARIKGIQFICSYRAVDVPQVVDLDISKLQTILTNLLANALKYTAAGGEVSIDLTEHHQKIELSVRDTGRGIHPEDLPRIFNRFYQTSQSHVPMEGGTGIGLALCHELAVVMHGRISVESRVGEGTTFLLELPKMVSLQPMPEIENEITAISADEQLQKLPEIPVDEEGRPRILIVEDNPGLRDYLQILLSKIYTIETASNGQEALDFLTSTSGMCDLVLSDIMMPVMDGYQLLENLKNDDRFRHIPVIILTARADMSDKLRALRIGVDDYLLKPFETAELSARIENLLTNYARRISLADDETADEPISAGSIPTGSAEDMEWLGRLEGIVQSNMGQFDVNAEMLAAQMFISRSQLFRRIKQLTGLSMNEYVQEIRFQQARILLEQRKYATVKAVALSVGFKHANHFAINYRKRFGKSPTEYFS